MSSAHRELSWIPVRRDGSLLYAESCNEARRLRRGNSLTAGSVSLRVDGGSKFVKLADGAELGANLCHSDRRVLS